MHSKTLARPLFCSLFLALPLMAGCVSEWSDSDDPFDNDRDSDGVCRCDDDNNNGGNNNGGNNNGGNNNGGNNNGGEECPATEDGAIFVGTDTTVCTAVEFTCPDTHSSFNIAGCGCGCEPLPTEVPMCPEQDAEGVTWISSDMKVCSTITFTCPEGSEAFNETCGCGCIASAPPPPACPDATAANVHYLGEDGSAVCEMVAFTCPAGCIQFNDECGCGCVEP